MGKINHKIIILWGMALFVLSFINSAQAFKLHLILACDEEAYGIDKSVMANYQNMKDFFMYWFGDDLLDIVPLKTRDLTEKSIYDAIDSMEVASEDTVLFYYSGWAPYDYQHGTQLLTLASRDNIKRFDILKKLRAKNAKFLILLTDYCNYISDNDFEIPEPSWCRCLCGDGIIKLFMDASGELDITSSRIGELSLCDRHGGLFTQLFVRFLQENRHNKEVEWTDLQKKVQPELTKYFKLCLEKEEIEYLDLKKMGAPIPPGAPEKQYDQRMYIYAFPGMPIRFGAGIKLVDDQLNVMKVIPDSPAGKAGVEVGDILMEINGSPLKTYGDYDILLNYSPRQMKLKVKKSNGEIKDLDVVLAFD